MKFPHKLDLYRLAVQHPCAEVTFVHKAFTYYHPRCQATRLREDFAGTCALATQWVAEHPNHRALAIDLHAPALRWAWTRAKKVLGPRAVDLHLVNDNVMNIISPRVDAVIATNFSTYVWRDRAALRAYFAIARRSLAKRGVLVIDAYGGPSAMKIGVQCRTVVPPRSEHIAPFEYQWEQRSYDAVTGRIDCRIHFKVRGKQLRNAFVYDWRLWTLPELIEVMREAGFADAEVWCDDEKHPGHYRGMNRLPDRSEWVAYVVGIK